MEGYSLDELPFVALHLLFLALSTTFLCRYVTSAKEPHPEGIEIKVRSAMKGHCSLIKANMKGLLVYAKGTVTQRTTVKETILLHIFIINHN